MKRKMTLKRRFIVEVFDGDEKAYRKARKEDYLKVQYEWTLWMDSLCKSGEISQRTWNTALF